MEEMKRSTEMDRSDEADRIAEMDGSPEDRETGVREKNETEARRREIREAIHAGQAVLEVLQKAEKSMKSASGWGVWDIFGGGLFTSLMKHSHIDDGKEYLEEASSLMKTFQREMKDVEEFSDFNLEIPGVEKFFDIFADNIFADIMVQNKIDNSRADVQKVISRVKEAVARLQEMEDEL